MASHGRIEQRPTSRVRRWLTTTTRNTCMATARRATAVHSPLWRNASPHWCMQRLQRIECAAMLHRTEIRLSRPKETRREGTRNPFIYSSNPGPELVQSNADEADPAALSRICQAFAAGSLQMQPLPVKRDRPVQTALSSCYVWVARTDATPIQGICRGKTPPAFSLLISGDREK